jgi:hypothetical protein
MLMLDVRMRIYTQLGSARALEIAAYTTEENPTSETGILKGIAAVAESLWVMALLIDHLPVMVLENSSKVRDDFNDEPLTRDASGLAKYRDRLMARVDAMIGQLKSPAEDSGDFKVFSCGAVDENGVPAPVILADNFIGKRI